MSIRSEHLPIHSIFIIHIDDLRSVSTTLTGTKEGLELQEKAWNEIIQELDCHTPGIQNLLIPPGHIR